MLPGLSLVFVPFVEWLDLFSASFSHLLTNSVAMDKCVILHVRYPVLHISNLFTKLFNLEVTHLIRLMFPFAAGQNWGECEGEH